MLPSKYAYNSHLKLRFINFWFKLVLLTCNYFYG